MGLAESRLQTHCNVPFCPPARSRPRASGSRGRFIRGETRGLLALQKERAARDARRGRRGRAREGSDPGAEGGWEHGAGPRCGARGGESPHPTPDASGTRGLGSAALDRGEALPILSPGAAGPGASPYTLFRGHHSHLGSPPRSPFPFPALPRSSRTCCHLFPPALPAPLFPPSPPLSFLLPLCLCLLLSLQASSSHSPQPSRSSASHPPSLCFYPSLSLLLPLSSLSSFPHPPLF